MRNVVKRVRRKVDAFALAMGISWADPHSAMVKGGRPRRWLAQHLRDCRKRPGILRPCLDFH